MAAIHRLLCTHCTFGTSELESSSADNAGKVLGYSVRKSSLPDAERGQLRQVFRAVERLLSYGLPKDATAAHKETLSAETAPRRLIFFPNLGGWQVAGQVSYRTFDTSQPPRPGSYFADLIVAKAPDPRSRDPEPAWSPCDVLQLWGVGPDRKTRDQAGWWISSEDELAAAEVDGPWKPIAPPSVAAVREPRSPLIDDDAAHRFLSADAVAADPLVPARWWAMPAERRRELVAHMLQATLLGPARGNRETVTIAAEPSVAAILFYIVCRLLPRRIAAGVSFSTYEPAPERPLTGLVATTFLNEEAPTADLPPELAQRGFACNTFRDVFTYGRCQPPPEQGYVCRLVALAAANDWAGIDSLLAAINADGLKATDLDELIKIDHLVTAYFGGDKLTGLSARRGPQEARFLRERFRGVLETQAATRADCPSDLVEAAIICLEGDLENLWTAGGPVRALLEGYLPDGEGLTRLLTPSQGIPAAPRAILAATVVSETLRGNTPHLPSPFITYCVAASAGRDRQPAKALLRDVLRGLPDKERTEVLVGEVKHGASLADLLLDVARDELTPSERDGLGTALTELLSHAVKKLTAKDLGAAAEMLARQGDVAGSISKNHPSLQAHLDDCFRALLDDNAREVGRHLVDAAGRSRVAGLQQWVDHSLDRGHVGQGLAHWKKLHDALAHLAQDAPPWRSWARPAPPKGVELPAAVTAIEGLRPFNVANRTNSSDRQQLLAKTVVQTFKQALPEGMDLRARWESVGHWLDRALAEEAERRAPSRVQRASNRSAVATYGLFVGAPLTAMVFVGLVAYSQGALEKLLPDARRRQIAAAPEDPDKTDPALPTEAGQNTVNPPGTAATTGPAEVLEPPTASPEAAAPPLTAEDVDLKLNLANGKISVSWNHERLAPRIRGVKLTWNTPNNARHNELQPSGSGQATIDTKDGGFGKYEVKFSVTPGDGNGEPFDKTDSVELPALPPMQLSEPAIELRDGKPCMRVKFTPVADEKRHGDVSYEFTGPSSINGQAKAAGESTLEFELPESVTPANYHAQLEQFTLMTVVPQGPGPAQNLPPVAKPDEKQELLATLKQKQHITALADDPGDKAQLLCNLPWSLGLDKFDLWLMTPEFKPGTSLQLGPKDTSSKTPRWPCKATVRVEDEDQESAEFVIGHFEFEARSAWQPRLQFKPVQAREKGNDAAYAALRCCRLCLVIAEQPIATSQLVKQSSLGPLTIKFPSPSKPIAASMPHLQQVPDCVDGLVLKMQGIIQKAPHLSLEFGPKPNFTLTMTSSAGESSTAAIRVTGGAVRVEAFKFKRSLVIKSEDSHLDKINRREKAIESLMNLKANENKDSSADQKRREWDKNIQTATDAIKKAKDELDEDRRWNACVEAVKAAEFTIPDWQIVWETKVAQSNSPLPAEASGGTAVVFILGSKDRDPVVFKVSEK